MKTSVIKVLDMLSVLTVDEVEGRFVEVPGVESATVNYAAGNVTVRFDETMLEVADITVFVHQRGQQSAGETQPKEESRSASDHQPAVTPAPVSAPAAASPSAPAPPKADTAPAALSASTTAAVKGHADGSPPGATPSPAAARTTGNAPLSR